MKSKRMLVTTKLHRCFHPTVCGILIRETLNVIGWQFYTCYISTTLDGRVLLLSVWDTYEQNLTIKSCNAWYKTGSGSHVMWHPCNSISCMHTQQNVHKYAHTYTTHVHCTYMYIRTSSRRPHWREPQGWSRIHPPGGECPCTSMRGQIQSAA